MTYFSHICFFCVQKQYSTIGNFYYYYTITTYYFTIHVAFEAIIATGLVVGVAPVVYLSLYPIEVIYIATTNAYTYIIKTNWANPDRIRRNVDICKMCPKKRSAKDAAILEQMADTNPSSQSMVT